jgi:uncharacterized protein
VQQRSRGSSPFVFARPVGPEDLIDRESEVQELMDLVEGSHHARLTAPRRYGKTTVLARLAHEAERTLDMTSITVDLSRVLSVGDVAIRVEDAYRRATDGPVLRSVRDVVRSWNLGITLGAGGLAAMLESDPKTDPLPALHRLLDLPRDAHERTGRRVLVCFDEFHELLRLDGLDGVLRSHIQHHGTAAAYVFAGSEPGMMEALFAERERPLFGQAQPVQLGPLPTPALADAVEERFAATGRDPGEALDALLEVARGHPQRAMLLAHHLWRTTDPGTPATLATWSRTLDDVLATLGDGFDRFLDSLPGGQLRVLFAVALSSHGLTSTYTRSRFGLPKGSAAAQARTALIARGEILPGTPPRVTDPLLALWLGQRRQPPGA